MAIRKRKIENGSIFFIYLFLLFNLLITIQHTTAQRSNIYHLCSGANYTNGSTFQSNLNILFPSIIQNRYYNATVGQSPDTVYGSVQCRGDITLDVCQNCVDFAAQDVNNKCPNSKQAIIWYDECMLRYSNQDYFTIMEDTPLYSLLNMNNVSNPDQFKPILANLMNELAKQAVSSFSTNFATGDTNYTNFQRLYGLVQCTADIPSSSCSRCLLRAISELPKCCVWKEGGRVISTSCYVRYEVYPFFEATVTPPRPQLSPPPLVSPPSSTNTTAPNGK
ncbi:hypothetical protein MKX03_019388 [Papaver bracteatum]|nr:hypothetical protein MKX03_019388 [Papaver bracteatum]